MTSDAPARTVSVRRQIARSPADVFEAWTDPDALVTWWGGALARTLSAAVDLRVGGAYRLTMQSGSQVFAVEGVYREVAAPDRWVYTRSWDGLDVESGESLVTVEFQARDEGTEVVVTHEGLQTEAGLSFHDRGWTSSIELLAHTLSH